jgi:alanyl-tRNA synthetase
MRAHTSTHILQAALRRVFGEVVSQQGSHVSPDEFRFDFSFPETFPKDKISEIEFSINEIVFQGIPVDTKIMKFDEAKANGALAFFEEKYGDTVRVVQINKVSKELCGGTHVSNTSEIGVVVLTGVRAVASGVKRIEGLSGLKAYSFLNEKRNLSGSVSELLDVQEEDILEKTNDLVKELKETRRQLGITRMKLFERTIPTLKPAVSVENVPVYAEEFENISLEELRKAYDIAKKKLISGIVIFVSKVENGEFVIVGRLSDDAPSAIDLFKKMSSLISLKGGGTERIAQGSSNEKHSITEFLRILG